MPTIELFLPTMNVLVLFYEFADYMLTCYEELSVQKNCNVYIVKYPVNKEAPFIFNVKRGSVKFFDKPDVENLLEFSKQINPSLLIVSGWGDKDYLRVSKYFYKKIPTVLIFDNKWRSTPRQWLAVVFSNFFLKKRFSHCFIPYKEQLIFANKLGYDNDFIITGLYCCNYNIFNKIAEKRLELDSNTKKRFVYVGRYYEFKGISDLWKAFIDISPESDWELWCVGTGDVVNINHPRIKHFGFVQPIDLENILVECSVFIMPSRVEPWGVALHEMTSAGFPVIVSDQVGAAVQFFEEGKNGFMFHTPDTDELKNCLKKIIALDNNQLYEMGNHSRKLAATLTPEIWASRLAKLLE